MIIDSFLYKSNNTSISGNNFNDNWLRDTSVIDSGEVIMATTTYTCEPSALAPILKGMEIYTTEAEIAQIADTDETGTTLHGLKTAVIAKGITAIAARLTTDKLQANYLVVLNA